jgi:hypothetical protein
MECDDEGAVLVGDGPEPPYEPLDRIRVLPNGRPYRIPEPGKRVIDLQEDCGLILEDVEFLRHMPGIARFYLDEGNPIINAQWKKQNLLRFRKPWRPCYRLPK